MKSIQKIFLLIAVIGLIMPTSAIAQNIFPKGELAPNVHHTGDVWLTHVKAANEVFDHSITVATFAPAAKLDWHLHPKGQQLIILDGEGTYQERGKEIQILQKGEIVQCAPGVEHWHASTPGTGVTYLAITGDAPTQWLEPIPEEKFMNIDADSIRKENIQEELVQLSKKKWQWMANKDVEKLENLFHDQSKFVHMSGSWKKDRELEIIESGSIWYKNAEVHDVAVEVFDDTAVLWNRITLTAHVRGSDVENEFTVTEFYKKEGGDWKLLDLTFSSVRDTHEIEK